MAGFVALGPVDRTVYRVGTLGRTYVTSLKKALRKRVSHNEPLSSYFSSFIK